MLCWLVISKADMEVSHEKKPETEILKGFLGPFPHLPVFPHSFFTISSLACLSKFLQSVFVGSQLCYCHGISEARSWLVSWATTFSWFTFADRPPPDPDPHIMLVLAVVAFYAKEVKTC